MQKIYLLCGCLLFCFYEIRSQPLQAVAAGTIPPAFIENKGQILDQHGQHNHEVLFHLHHRRFSLSLKAGGFSYELFADVADPGKDEAGLPWPATFDEPQASDRKLAAATRIDVTFENPSPSCRVIPSLPQPSTYHFYRPPLQDNRFEKVKGFSKITYTNLYPGIDLVFELPDSAPAVPHYSFHLRPGADPALLVMKYAGFQKMMIGDDGSLQLETFVGRLRETAPLAFSGRAMQPVACHRIMSDSTIRFVLADYASGESLTIDPAIFWGTYYGGESTEDVAEVTVDAQLHPTVAGNTLSTAHIATAGAYQNSFAGGFHDFFIARFNPTAQLEWATYLGGDNRELGFGVTSDESGNIYFNGKSNSDGLATAGAYQTVRGGNDDAVVARFSPDGTLDWSSYFGGPGNDQYRAFALLGDTLYLCGYTESAENIATPGAFQLTYAGEGDGMLTCWTNDGQVIWSTYEGAAGQDRFHSITNDASGRLYLAGTTSSDTGLTTPGSYQTEYGGGEADVMLSCFTSAGERLWNSYYGGESADRGRGIETDTSGRLFISGFGSSTAGIATPGAHQQEWSEGYDEVTNEPLDDAFLFSLSSAGDERYWGTYYGGPRKDELWGMDFSPADQAIYLAGSTYSPTGIVFGNAWQKQKGNGSDAVFSRWNADGSIVYGSYFGKGGADQFEDVETDAQANLYLAGKTGNNEMPATYGVHQVDSNGGTYDGLLYKFYGGAACRDLYEPNESFNQAAQIFARTTVDSLLYGYDGNLENSADHDFYKVEVEDSFRNVLIELNGLLHNYELRLYNENGLLVDESIHEGLMPDTIHQSMLEAGTYFIEVAAGSPEEFDTLNCYHLNLVKRPTIFTGGVFSAADCTLLIHPNPAADELLVGFTAGNMQDVELTVMDAAGRRLISLHFDYSTASTISLNIASLAPGFYRLHWSTGIAGGSGFFMKGK